MLPVGIELLVVCTRILTWQLAMVQKRRDRREHVMRARKWAEGQADHVAWRLLPKVGLNALPGHRPLTSRAWV